MDLHDSEARGDLPLDLLPACALSELEKLGYSTRTLRHYRRVWGAPVGVRPAELGELVFEGSGHTLRGRPSHWSCPDFTVLRHFPWNGVSSASYFLIRIKELRSKFCSEKSTNRRPYEKTGSRL